MRLGRLGNDARIAEVVAAAERRGDRVLLACDDVGPGAAATWDGLLDPATCDVVLVGSAGWGPARAEAVRTLVQAGRPLLLAHPLELSMLWAFELDMIRRDSGAVLVPLLPDRLHPLVASLRAEIEVALATGPGPLAIESLTLERRSTDRDRDAVLAHLARDADLVRVLAGDPARLAALGVPDVDGPWSSLTVGLSGPNHLPVRWQLASGQQPGLHLRLQSTAGTVEAWLPDDDALPWSWTGPEPRHGHHDRGAAMLAVLDRALAGSPPAEDAVPPASWADASRAIELAETVPRSLTRGRAVDLHAEEFTELGTFRGTMASLGCGLVLAALVVLVLATLVGGIAHELGWQFASDVVGAWPAVVLAVLGLFLALQFLPLLVGGSRSGPRPGATGRRHE